MGVKSKVALAFLLTCLLASVLVVAAEDPAELRQCQKKCEREEGRERRECSQRCEREYREREGSRGSNPREEEREKERGREGKEGKNPYVFEEEQFSTSIRSREGHLAVLQRFDERSKFLSGLKNYRMMLLRASPRTFIVPAHLDAEAVLFVITGEATITLIRENRRESFNLRCGDIIRVPAGVPAYLINRHENEELRIAKFLNTVSVPGRVQAFFGAGGENPQSFYTALSNELLEAAFKTGREQLRRLFGQQRQGIIVKATREQIEALSQQEEEARGSFNLFDKRPSQANKWGKLLEANFEDYRELEDLNLDIAYSNITGGGMEGPFYNSEATKVAIVVDGEGYFEMACPHISGESGREKQRSEREESSPRYQKITARLKRGTVFVVPAGHPVAIVASGNRNLEVACFGVNAKNNQKYALVGKKNPLTQLQREAKELAFGISAREVDRILENNPSEEIFNQGPRSQEHEGRAFA